MGEAVKRRSRAPSLLPPFVAVLLLVAPTARAFLSTIHLGRTLKALRARDQERQLLLQQEQELQQQQREFETLPPGLPVSLSSERTGDGEDPDPTTEAATTRKESEHEDVGSSGTAVGETHPSWGGSPDDDGGGGGDDEVSRGWWHKKGQGETDGADDTAAPAGHDAAAAAADGVDVVGEKHGLLGEQGAGGGDRSDLSTTTATAAADVADVDARQQEAPAEDLSAGHSTLTRDAESGESIDAEAVAAAPAPAAAAAAAAGAVEAAAVGSAPADAAAAPQQEAALGEGSEDDHALAEPMMPSTASASEVAAQEEQPEEEVEDQVSEEEEEREGEEEGEEAAREGEQEKERGGDIVFDYVNGEEMEAAAIEEILRLRADEDQAVQDAAARAVEALPATQRECFEDVKAFAFGGEGAGGLPEEDVAALETVAICGDRAGVVLAFLRHSKFDVRKAKESIQRCCAWRKENRADDIFGRAVSPAKMRKHREYWPTGFHKKDRLGRPVFYDRVGQSDLSKLRAEPDGLDQDEMVQIFTQNMEARRRFVLTRLSREAGHPVDQMTTVLDLTGLGVRHMSKEAVAYTRRISEVFQDNYSGMTCSLLILNAPWVFNKGWKIIEGFLSEDTVAKVKVLGKGEAGLKELEKYVPKENIPEFMGGESPAVIGPSDPLWTEVDSAVRAWAEGGDPFLHPTEVKRVSQRIARERAAVRSSSASTSGSALEEKSEEKVSPKSTPTPESPTAVATGKRVEGSSGVSVASEKRAARRAAKERQRSGRDDAEDDAVALPVGGDDGGGATADAREVRGKGSRRLAAAAAGTASVGGEGSVRRRTAAVGSRDSSSGGGGGGKRSSKRRRREEKVAPSVGQEAEREAGDKKKHRRKRSGLASASASAGRRPGRPSSSSRRTPSSVPASSSSSFAGLTKDGSDAAGRPASSPALEGKAAPRTPSPSSSGGGAKNRRERKHARESSREGEEPDAAARGGEESERADGGGDDGEGAVEEAAAAERAVAARYVERFAEVLGPALGPFFRQAVDALLAAAMVLLGAVEGALRCLRDLFFEQIEVDE
ncbi:unnamed protein product [Scytosiphon promiscuus]